MIYKLLITTSWTGSRLWELTKDINKALIKIWWKEIISHIIESYPKDMEIVITLWYKWEKVKEFLENNYKNRKITYVYVDKFEWPWSSLWYSMLQTKDALNTPFIFHCNDTIINKYIPITWKNWAWWCKVNNSSQYTTFRTNWNKIISYDVDKWAINYDYAHIWVIGIQEYEKFFNILEKLYTENPNNSNLNDVYVLTEMLKTGSSIEFIEFKKWLDTWNIEGLKKAEEEIGKRKEERGKLKEERRKVEKEWNLKIR
jgi:dTDP-glucose pyrophosphorylase